MKKADIYRRAKQMTENSIIEIPSQKQKKQLVTFHIEEHYFGVDILDVKEINSEFQITPIAHAPEEVSGYVNLRGQIYLVVDLRLPLGLKSSSNKGQKPGDKLVIFKESVADPFGIIVDEIGDVINVSEQQIEKISGAAAEEKKFNHAKDLNLITGICKLESDLLMIIYSKNILATVENKNLLTE